MRKILKVQQVLFPAKETVSLLFDKDESFSNYLPGQHLRLATQVNGKKVGRTYSICTAPDIDQHVAVTIRRIEGGLLSNFLVDNAQAGMEIELEGPFGAFTIQTNQDQKRHLILLAAGSGITPLYSILRSVLHQEPHSVASLVYANRSFDRIIFHQQLQTLEEQFPDRFSVYHAISEVKNLPPNFELFFKGRLSRLIIKKLLQGLLTTYEIKPEFYLCGPSGFMHIAEEAIVALGKAPSSILKENFYNPNDAVGEGMIDFITLPAQEVSVDIRGILYSVQVKPGQSILQAAIAQGIPAIYSCQQGQCGQCRSLLVHGQLKMKQNYILSADELADGQVLLCQGYPLTEGILVQALL
jgi:ring-1,2-phenylacetyl-CoA epoxidase subunit PaaE